MSDTPHDPTAPHSEIAALTRRYENALQIVRGDIAQLDNRLMSLEDNLTAFKDTTGDNFDAVNSRLDALTEEVRNGNARIIELLSGLVGRDPDAS
jgi:hypothetical protein